VLKRNLAFGIRVVLSAAALVCSSLAVAAGNHSIEMAPLAAGPYPVACSNVAQDTTKIAQLGGNASDYWEGIPNGGTPRYITQILAEPQDAIVTYPRVPNDRGFYPQTANTDLPVAIIVCYPTTADNFRPDYALPDGQLVPKMQRAGQRPIFANPLATLPMRGTPGMANNKLPLLIFSHGFASSPLDNKSVDFLVKLAAYGYVVAAPFHADARFTRIRLESLSDVLYIIANFDYLVEMQALRPLGVKATIDALLAHQDFGPRINADQIGGIGGSMGGATMTWLAGAELTCTYPGLSSRPTVQDPRIRAFVGYVPYAGQRLLPAFGDDNATASKVKAPYLAIGGTADTTAPTYLMEQAMNNFKGSRYFVALRDVQHGYETRYADDVFGWTVPFFDYYVRGNTKALVKLTNMKNVAGGLDDFMRIDYTAPTSRTLGAVTVEETYNGQVGRDVLAYAKTDGSLASITATPAGSRLNYNAFRVFTDANKPLPLSLAQTGATLAPVCLFTGSANAATILLTIDPVECEAAKRDTKWNYGGTPFSLFKPVNGKCGDGLLAVRRAFNNATTPSQAQYRYSVSNGMFALLEGSGWKIESALMCAPL
jgi:Platelet-activating factor acetylhydrolase, isoform II